MKYLKLFENNTFSEIFYGDKSWNFSKSFGALGMIHRGHGEPFINSEVSKINDIFKKLGGVHRGLFYTLYDEHTDETLPKWATENGVEYSGSGIYSVAIRLIPYHDIKMQRYGDHDVKLSFINISFSKLLDEWYLIYVTKNNDIRLGENMYKCDQMDGLENCIELVIENAVKVMVGV